MAVKIRMKRIGAKKSPFYRIIVADSRAARNGRFIEEIGYYNPLTEPKTIKIDNDRAQNWLNNGAKPTYSVDRLFKSNGVYEQKEENTEE
ncbi:MAG: 30S ribosomal protein S16 [Tissierella sp.]|uniref:30S ribosomal protein S16 n=1 Tax=Tissierella sp. TaxID=41274 RepID=UPI003F9734EB